MKIVYWCNTGNLKLCSKLGDHFEKEGWESAYLMLDSHDKNILQGMRPGALTYNLSEYMRSNWDSFSKDLLPEYQEKYADINFWEIYYSDRYLVKYNYEDGIRFIIGHVRFLEYLFTTEKPNAFFYDAPSNITAYLAVKIGKYYGVKSIGSMSGALTPRHMMRLFDDEFCSTPRAKALYFSEHEFTAEETKEAERLISKVSEYSSIPNFMSMFSKLPHLRVGFILDVLKYFARMFVPRFQDKYNYICYKGHQQHLYRISLYMNYIRIKKYFEAPQSGEKYYVLPLHYQPEVSTGVWASKYEKQLFFIDNVAKSIPLDCMVYVKEHYAGIGCRDVEFYKTLHKYKNVRLIGPFENIKALIDSSVATITLTSTAGLECILRKKPVFVCGRVFYDFFDDVTLIEDVFSEREKFKSPKPICEEKALRFANCYLKMFYDGNTHPEEPSYLTDENIKNYSIAVKDFMGLQE